MFDPTFLPAETYRSFKLGPTAWASTIRSACREGINDIDCLADIVFYLNHPELEGRPLSLNDRMLVIQWQGFRSRVEREFVDFTYQKILRTSDGSVRGYDGSHRMWRSRNGHILDGSPISPDMWSWHEAARYSGFSPRFHGGLRVES